MSEDFSKGKRGPVLRPDPNKKRITIRLDADVINHFKQQVLDAGGGNYQSLINAALRQHIETSAKPLEETIRSVIREELRNVG